MTDFNTYYKDVLSKDKDGKYFERKFVPWFLKNDPVWKTIVKKVWLFEDYPHKKKCRWQRADEGTDIVMEDVDGNTWAIQCKNWNPEKTVIRHGDYDSFITDSENECVDKRLFITTQKKISKTIQNDINKKRNIRPVHVILYNDFVESALVYPKKKSDLIKSHKRLPIKPFPYQTKLLEQLTPKLKKTDRGQLIMACGTGKSYMGVWTKERLKAKKNLILVPTLMLISDTFKNWLTASKKIPKILCVCSDPTVTQNKMKDSNYDALLESLDDVPFPVENELSKIKKFMNCKEDTLIISTYDSSHLIRKAQKSMSHEFDLIIFDEAHNCVGLEDNKFNEALYNNNIKSKKRLFMTATQKIFSNRLKKYIKKKETADMIPPVVDMSDEQHFGPTFANYSFGQAIRDGNLSDYKVVVVGVSDEELKNNITDRELVKIKSLISPSKYIKHDMEYISILSALHRSIKKYNIRRLISFHSRQKWASDFSKYIKDYNEITNGKISFNTHHIQGDIPTRIRLERLSILKYFEEYDCSIVSNARCLTEGINVPNLDAIAFIDSKQSPVDIVQAIGRAIRKSDSKDFGIIFLPLFINQGDFKKYKKSKIDLTSFIKDCPGYTNTINIIQALKSHDERLVLQLNELRTRKGEKPKKSNKRFGLTNFHFDLPKNIGLDFTNSLVTHLVDATTSSWYEMYGELKKYKHTHKNCLVPIYYKTKSELPLGSWVSNQRQRKLGNYQPALSDKQLKLLNDLNFIWDVELHQFEMFIHELKLYISSNGDTLVPDRYVSPSGYSLGATVNRYRGLKAGNMKDRYGKPITLKKEREKALLKLGFVFNLDEHVWEKNFAELEAYKLKYNHVKIVRARGKNKTNPEYLEYHQLAEWVNNQLKQIREFLGLKKPTIDKRNGKPRQTHMTRSRKNRLLKIGIVVDKYGVAWDKHFEALKEFKKKHKHCNVPINHMQGDIKLGSWFHHQKKFYKPRAYKNYRRNAMPLDRKKKLDSLCPNWHLTQAKRK